jgi:acetyl-CoA acyltransferase
MGIGQVPATRKALERAGIALDDVGLVELNEAFAARVLAVLYEWGMDPDERLNPNGGSIALGHPLATMCIGVGQGIAMVVEKVE